MENYIIYSNEVKDALQNNKPIVALESTIITHGMPYPINLEMAIKVEQIIKDNNVVPATIAVIDGKIHVGLNKEELKYLASIKDGVKISRRDLSYTIIKKFTGGTTVAATMIIAKLAGIKIFATGGIGGVHFDYANTLDVSADLEELGKTNICVVCAGPKSILDIEKTLEYLETKGVTTIGYNTTNLPVFYSSTSPFKLNFSLNNSKDIAKLINVQENLKLNSGILIFNPIPKEAEIPYEIMIKHVNKAILQAKNANIKGKELTPFLLDELENITEGKSLQANLALIYNNALLAAEIARSYYKIKNDRK